MRTEPDTRQGAEDRAACWRSRRPQWLFGVVPGAGLAAVIRPAVAGGLNRVVLTGAPGSGKTAILEALGNRGWAVVGEAATDVIAAQQSAGVAEPWTRTGFCDDIVALQRQRQEAPTPAAVQFFDRSPLCTLALARFLGHPVTPLLAAEVERVVLGQVYNRAVLLVRPLGFITATSARRISYADALAFEAVHEQVYREYGFGLVEVAAGNLEDRVRFVEASVNDKDIDCQDA